MSKAPRSQGVDLVPLLTKTGKDMKEAEEGAFGFKGFFGGVFRRVASSSGESMPCSPDMGMSQKVTHNI